MTVICNVIAPLKDWHPTAALQQRNLEGGYAMPIKYRPAPCSQEELRDLFDYDHKTGNLIWRIHRNSHAGKIKPGDVAGTPGSNGYLVIGVNRMRYAAHRLVWLWHHGALPRHQLDHINGIRSDNRIENLREATAGENRQNMKDRANNTGLRGVYFNSRPGRVKRYSASIAVNGKSRCLGYFLTKDEAHVAYLKAKSELHKFQPIPRAV
jgi:hypothetical protein